MAKKNLSALPAGLPADDTCRCVLHNSDPVLWTTQQGRCVGIGVEEPGEIAVSLKPRTTGLPSSLNSRVNYDTWHVGTWVDQIPPWTPLAKFKGTCR
eukprot:3743111-Pyramimonas_sp.AAC.1